MNVLPRKGLIAMRPPIARLGIFLAGAFLVGHPGYAQKEHGNPSALPTAATASERTSSLPKVVVIGSEVYPAISTPTDQPRFDPSSSLLANTVAARTGLFGAAAREGLTWANRYIPGTDQTGQVQLYALSTSGNYGAVFGTRSSDNRSTGPENVIGSVSLVVADSDRPDLHWARYSEGYVPYGKTAFRLLINDENSIQNEGSPAPYADPYEVNPNHLLNNLRIDCGIGMGSSSGCSNPVSILNNGARYKTGIVFGANSIDPINGAITAIALPVDYGVSWFSAPGKLTWRLFSNAHGEGAGAIVLTDEAASFRIGHSVEPGLQVEKDAIRTPATIASGPVPSVSGTCQVHDQRGGTTAGAFVLSQDCSSGTIRLTLSMTAPIGWSCFASDLTQSGANLRETAYDTKSVTLTVTHAQRSDSVVFSCMGF